MSLFIGLISGTSMDGIDAALVDVEQNKLIHGITYPYSTKLQDQLLKFDAYQKHTLQSVLQLNHILGAEFAQAALALLKETPYQAADIQAIGSHGQTLYHDPNADIPTTLQLGCPHTIAAHTNITVVADFRTRDMVLGGQGAPFAPLYHQELFKNDTLPVALVNIGGIANLTILHQSDVTSGYDTGPGNALMDAWIKKHKNLPYDANGAWAQTGELLPELLVKLLEDAYFSKPTPKSIDKAYYSLSWLEQYLNPNNKPEDVQNTLLHLTAHSVADSVKFSAKSCTQVLLCGGGAHNQALIKALTHYLPGYVVDTTLAFNIHPDYIEAMMFAWLAKQTLSSNPVDLTRITGADKPAILGAIYA